MISNVHVNQRLAPLAASTFAACLLGACSLGPKGQEIDAAYGLSVAAEVHLPRSQREVATCLRERENSASYPQGANPGFTSTEIDGTNLRVTQWFYLDRGATWTTRFLLRPSANETTDVQVLLPVESSASHLYRRAALDVIANCQPKPAGTG